MIITNTFPKESFKWSGFEFWVYQRDYDLYRQDEIEIDELVRRRTDKVVNSDTIQPEETQHNS